MTKDEALKLALKALTNAYWPTESDLMPAHNIKECADAITAIKEALAQPEQEPVVWMYVNKSTHEVKFQKHMRDFVDHGAFSEVPLFSEPIANQEKTSGSPIPQRKPLSDEEIMSNDVLRYHFALNGGAGPISKQGRKVIDAIEAAHGIKGQV